MSEVIIRKEDYVKTDKTKQLIIRGEAKTMSVYKIPLEMLSYNVLNDRILAEISGEEDFDALTKEEKNEVIEELIWQTDPSINKKTMDNIGQFGQLEAGVVLPNGVLVDGNRRFTCIRKLYEKTGDIKHAYYEAVILDDDLKLTKKDIKRLELNIQHATEEKQGYNPINRAVAVYRDIEENGMFTIKEYATETGAKEADIKNLYSRGKLIEEFLDYAQAPGDYRLAKELRLDGPIHDLVPYTTEKKDPEEIVKYVAFDYLLLNKKDQKGIREVLKNVSGTQDMNEGLFENHEQIREEMQEKISESGVKGLRADEELRSKMFTNLYNIVETNQRKSNKDKIAKTVKKIHDDLKNIEADEIIAYSLSDRSIITEFEALKDRVNEMYDEIEQG